MLRPQRCTVSQENHSRPCCRLTLVTVDLGLLEVDEEQD